MELGSVYFESLGEPKLAKECYEKVLIEFDKSRSVQDARHAIGEISLALGEWDSARRVFEEEIKLAAPDSILSRKLQRLVDLCNRKKVASKGIGTFEGHENNSDSVMGDLLFAQQKYAKAELSYKKAIRIEKGYKVAEYCQMQIARCHASLGDYNQAMKDYVEFQNALKGSPYAPDALLRAGVLAVGPMNNSKEGARFYKKILELYPESPAASRADLYLAAIAQWEGNEKEALVAYQAVVDKYPKTEASVYAEHALQDFGKPIVDK